MTIATSTDTTRIAAHEFASKRGNMPACTSRLAVFVFQP